MQLTDDNVKFFSSGCTLFDLALGGGWALPRIFNIVGDKSVGKTLMAIEAFANFKLTFAKPRMRYVEVESAFDETYADVLGFPDEVEHSEAEINTVEEFEMDFYKFMRASKEPGLYILDSLDAICSTVELENVEKRLDGNKEKGSYGAEKAKDLSAMFRHIAREMAEHNTCLGIISQVRENIGAMFGESKSRSGGKALDFYASQVAWLSQIKRIEHQAMNVKRVTGVEVIGEVKKNKVGFPFRKAGWPLIFSYGVDDEISMINWMKEIKQITEDASKVFKAQVENARQKRDYKSLKEIRTLLRNDCTSLWNKIEAEVAPRIRKYEEVPPVAPTPPVMPSTPPPPPLKQDTVEALNQVADAVEAVSGINLRGVKLK